MFLHTKLQIHNFEKVRVYSVYVCGENKYSRVRIAGPFPWRNMRRQWSQTLSKMSDIDLLSATRLVCLHNVHFFGLLFI